jgi:hypothetical protein
MKIGAIAKERFLLKFASAIRRATIDADKDDFEAQARSLFRRPGAKRGCRRVDLPESVKSCSRQLGWAGIGLFPSSTCALGAKIVPLEVDLPRAFDIWLTYHPDSNRIP